MAYNILILIIPLVTAPYLARVIGVEGTGIYSYTYSVVQYFVLFAMLGINDYGNRRIAKVRDSKEARSKEFLSIYAIQVTTSVLSILFYILYIQFVKEYKLFAIIQLLYLIANCFDINWFFFGMEKFKLTVSRNMIIKIISTICIFLFVKERNDLLIYIVILAFSSLISQLALWSFLKKEIIKTQISWMDIKKHIKPIIILFVPVVAISLYNIMDKIMLGNIATKAEVGLYGNAEKIVNIPTNIITALGAVMLPKISNLVAKGEEEKVKEYISKSIEFITFLATPMYIGLMIVAVNFAPLFYGNEFIKSGVLIQYLSIIIIFRAWANVIRTEYLIPNEEDKKYIISVVLGAFVNVILNCILIPQYGSLGAVIGTIFAEFVVMFYQMLAVRKKLNIKKYIKYFVKFTMTGLIMYIVVKPFEYMIDNTLVLIFTQILLGGVVYLGLNWKYILSTIRTQNIVKERSRA